ncbi:MAG: hypothetical protein WB952_21270 [Terriglobales bacterium]
MNEASLQLCTVCGEQKEAGQVWFLVAESHWQDRLAILQWEDEVSCRKGMHRACSPAHVEELVVHWMTTGSLDFPFAIAEERLERRPSSCLPVVHEADTRGTRQIGELSVHRESMDRALHESPDSLQIILDELTDALKREAISAPAGLESAKGMTSGSIRQM